MDEKRRKKTFIFDMVMDISDVYFLPSSIFLSSHDSYEWYIFLILHVINNSHNNLIN